MSKGPWRNKKRRPGQSTLTSTQRRDLLSEILGVWDANPKWTLGQLIERACTIPTGERAPLRDVTDADLQTGIAALSPLGWEVEEFSAKPATPRPVETLEEQLERELSSRRENGDV